MKNQRGYIGLVVIVFLILFAAVVFPWKFPKLDKEGCVVGDPPDEEGESVFMPPIINVGAIRGEDGGWDESRPNVEYVMIRKNVPIFMDSDDPNYQSGYPDWMGRDNEAGSIIIRWPVIADTKYLGRHADPRHTILYPNANQPGFDVYYPHQTGEVELPYKTTDRAGLNLSITSPNRSILTLRTEGFVIFVHLGQDGNPVKLKYGLHNYFLVDFYQDKVMYETPDDVKGYKMIDIFQCIDPDAPASPAVVDPQQDRSQAKDQLQMEWFLLQGAPGMYAHCKPAVYLYPERKQLVNVKVSPKGFLGYTDPLYDPVKGWTVDAGPEGKLFTMNNEPITNNYLYYESKLYDSEVKKPVNGWAVKSEDLKDLFNTILPKLGLNKKEKADFENYWLNKLPSSPYYFVGIVDKNQRDYLEALQVIPNPDTSIRFSLYFEPLDQPKIVSEPIIQTPQRNGFTLVDWGGMIKLHQGTPFTCSQ